MSVCEAPQQSYRRRQRRNAFCCMCSSVPQRRLKDRWEANGWQLSKKLSSGNAKEDGEDE
jgi:hypothetical protein